MHFDIRVPLPRIVTFLRLGQSEKAPPSILSVRPRGITMLVRLSHPLNAELPILLTPDGNTTDLRDVQPLKSKLPIDERF